MAPPKKYKDLNLQDQILKRKVDHVQFERKRRERIQTAMQILKQMVPGSRNQVTLHQYSILENAIDYIRFLENICKKREIDVPPSPCVSYTSAADFEVNDNCNQGIYGHEYICNELQIKSIGAVSGTDDKDTPGIKIQDILN